MYRRPALWMRAARGLSIWDRREDLEHRTMRNIQAGDLKLLVVDDEPLGRSALIELCGRSEDVEVIGEAGSGVAAIDAAEKLCPDVMVIDVELPDMSGFDVLRAVETSSSPLGIMVTAHAVHAVTAFAMGAVDYLIKPITADRFANAIERARERCSRKAFANWQTRFPQESRLPRDLFGALEQGVKVVVGERQRRLYPLDPAKIDYIESDGNYVTIRTGDAEYISRDSIKRLAADLADSGFVRIERSLLVNVRSVQFVEPLGHGTFAFSLTSGVCLRSSATYREAILRVIPLHRCRAGNRRIEL
jgi:two-component system LytT family response regulator